MRPNENPTEPEPEVGEVFALVARIDRTLFGQHPAVQGAALAYLVAMFLLRHRGHGWDVDKEDAVRESLLNTHIAAVRQMVKETP